ncbi:hypothetical protein ACAG24_026590 [Mycobacterium sp. pW049]|uniref:hypothetical protein n=1 Tax=[Mycobacterium] bulgaricum TaxID=3238985 RepID=UPI00351BA483
MTEITKLDALTLRHVDPSQLLFQLRHPAFSVERPEWLATDRSGGIAFAPWIGGTVLATMHAQAERDAYFARVSVLGLYMSEEQEAAQEAGAKAEVDDSTLAGASVDELKIFAQRVSDDLYPFVRSELYLLSGRVQGIPGVMMQPYPKLEDNLEELHTPPQ